ncbi:shikimate kinase [Clostridium magnum]|uniref:Shikimate kinase n=1 Tax=Clostridium magnum DSM 2767 TaxID=1121326 RepID=A0A161WZ90_9CLOT|nr:shikimate kinase [Clostridium magnum]KZL92448.1 shikimate kinase 1 [Clostridium magnum DSM 2767]SHI26688.1 shikimate kinase [Clostridium magnum DSM 2767]
METMNKNIILVGMPGSGRTVIGKILSEKLGFKFFNTDQYIEVKSEESISELLNIEENNSRILENETIEKLSSTKSSIISAGIDVIKDTSNMKKLKENGVVIFIDRSVEKIVQDEEVFNNRSLLKNEVQKLHQLFHERYEIYKKSCDLHLINDNNIDEIVYYICSIWR